MNPVFYHPGGPMCDTECASCIPPNEPVGWYFWDETWSTPYGPFETEELANQKLGEYCRTYL